jgi:hypothetical protein
MSKRKTDIMITIEKAYEKFYKLLEQIDNSDIPPSEQYELYQDIESEIEQKKQQAYANMHEY